MAWLPLALGGISAASSIGSTLLGSRTQRRSDRDTNRANRELAQFAYSKDLEMWHRMNEYNRPAAQMERFGEAGLNPHLIYGQGTPGQAQSMPEYNAPRMEYNHRPAVDPMSALQGYMDMAQKSTQINYEKQKTDTEYMRTWLTQTQHSNLLTEGQIKALEYEFLNETLDSRIGTARHTMDHWAGRVIWQNFNNIVEAKRAEWASQGMNPNDATWLRLTIEALRHFGIDNDRIRSLMKGINLQP